MGERTKDSIYIFLLWPVLYVPYILSGGFLRDDLGLLPYPFWLYEVKSDKMIEISSQQQLLMYVK